MTSALVPEDGSNVTGANSYATLTQIRAYALSRGITITAVDADADILAIKAMDYIESFRNRFKGVKTYLDQVLQFPRASYRDSGLGIWIDDIQIADDEIPQELINIQCETVMAINAGVDFKNYNQKQKFIVEQKVGPLSQKFSESIGTSNNVTVTSISHMIDVLCNPTTNSVERG